MFGFDSDAIIGIMVFSIPIVAIVGGIIAGIVKTLGRQRLAELAQQERIAAIQRGVDVSKLPPLGVILEDEDSVLVNATPEERDQRRAQGLMIGGIVTLAAGIGIGAFLSFIADNHGDRNIWAVGIVPATVGLALLLSSWLVRPRPRT
jgi:hypothetical protein